MKSRNKKLDRTEKMRLQLQKELVLCPVKRAYNIVPKSVKQKANNYLQEILYELKNPTKAKPFQTVGNYEATRNN